MATQSLLVAMDGSGNALRALKYAIALARDRGQKLHLVHVLPRIQSGRLMPQSLVDEHYASQTEAAFKSARAIVKRARIPARFEACLGEPAPTLVAYARKHRCAQIVIGNRGHGAIAGVLLGSVAMKVIYLATVPVTLVK